MSDSIIRQRRWLRSLRSLQSRVGDAIAALEDGDLDDYSTRLHFVDEVTKSLISALVAHVNPPRAKR